MKKLLFTILLTINLLANIIPDNNSNVYIEKSLNGIDIINIATPDEKGISVSTFKEFNIPKEGAVLNKGFNDLTKKQQKYILEYQDNLMYLSKTHNSSKGAKSVVKGESTKVYEGFTKYKGVDINDKVREFIAKKQEANRDTLIKLIEEFKKINEKK